jgi:hypothetical protein
MVWRIRQGVVDGTPLDNLNVAAVVSGSANLGMEKGERRTALYVDETATPAQKKVLVSLFSERYSETFGKVVSVKSARITFEAKGDRYRVEIPNQLRLEVQAFTDPFDPKVRPYFLAPGADVPWYRPLVSLSQSRYGISLTDQYQDTVLNTRWKRFEPNPSSYVGTFELPVSSRTPL